MPTIPQTTKLTASSYDILNAIRGGASALYQERVPIATQENLRLVGQAVGEYESTQNEFINALVNRIARVVITSKSYENPLREFKKGILEYGESIEEVFVQIAKAHPFNPSTAENEVFKREIPDVLAIFHRLNVKNFYKATISNDQLRQAFLSAQGITDLIAKIVEQMYTGSELDEFLMMKQLIRQAATDGKMYPVKIPVPSAITAKEIVATIKAISNKISFMSSSYNYSNVLTHTPKDSQVILMDADFDATIDVEVLASAFNLSKVEFMGRRVLVDNFGGLTGVVAALVDRDWFMVYDNYMNFTENYNGEGLYWNYFYHIWKTFSTSPFAQAIIFTTEPVAVTGITIAPTTGTVKKGNSLQLRADVTGSGLVDKSVIYSVAGGKRSVINNFGLLMVDGNETATELIVTATSGYDPTKTATATITVS